MQNRRLDPTGLATPGETHGLMGTGLDFNRQAAAGRVVGRCWNQTAPFFQSKPGPLAGYPDPLLTLGWPPWSTKALVHTVHKIEHYDIHCCGSLPEEFHDKGPCEWPKQGLNSFENFTEAYMVEVIAESHFEK